VAKQQTFAGLAWQNKGKQTRRERFLAEMDAIIPWAQLLEVIDPHYPKAGNGRPPLGLEKMLRIYFLQIWFNLSDPGAEEALYDSEPMRRFARIELSVDKVPDESTILNFRHLLEKHDLTKAMFERINGLMEQKGLLLRSGTIVDATIIAAPSSTKNATESRDPEMKQTKKGNNWHFGMKVHVGTDRRGVVHSLRTTHAATADITEMNTLLHGQERAIFGDQAYWKEADRQRFRADGVRYRVNRRGTAQRPLTEHNPLRFVDPDGRLLQLSGCVKDQTSAGCKGQINLYLSTFGKQAGDAAKYLAVGKNGIVSFNGISGAAFAAKFGLMGRATNYLVSNRAATFTMTTDRNAMTEQHKGAYSDVYKGPGGMFGVDPTRFPTKNGYFGMTQTATGALVHEIGHAVASLIPGFAEDLQLRKGKSFGMRGSSTYEGYATASENAWRHEVLGVGPSDIRSGYYVPGDIYDSNSSEMYPP